MQKLTDLFKVIETKHELFNTILHILEETKLHFDKYFRILIVLALLYSTEKMHRLHLLHVFMIP